ncbi:MULTISPECIES: hypothetical protein [Bacillus amyloliquefaciens group]|uniref:hypothetical protein n=1 Tax=Bacillus amyloliquefaciens group TaxID=1938374 RepID=UPI00073C24D1|nr:MULTISPECIES: hypothetical protein [Bacillus amyloliquefaciens group]KTF59059.1 hypothetical protein AR691_17400 [Bacillus amyloliquefaciens]
MNKYAIGIYNMIDGDHKVEIVEEETSIKAICKAVGDEELWGIVDGETPYSTEEEACVFYLQGDLSISEPVLIEKYGNPV